MPLVFFFFQAEDGIRDGHVTGVQTCALPIWPRRERLFVYGTLRRGFALHPLLRKLAVRYVGRGKIQGHLYDLGRFPGAVPSSSPQNKITGEVYELSNPDKQLEELDRAEEYHREQPRNSLFVRGLSLVRLENGRRFKA